MCVHIVCVCVCVCVCERERERERYAVPPGIRVLLTYTKVLNFATVTSSPPSTFLLFFISHIAFKDWQWKKYHYYIIICITIVIISFIQIQGGL